MPDDSGSASARHPATARVSSPQQPRDERGRSPKRTSCGEVGGLPTARGGLGRRGPMPREPPTHQSHLLATHGLPPRDAASLRARLWTQPLAAHPSPVEQEPFAKRLDHLARRGDSAGVLAVGGHDGDACGGRSRRRRVVATPPREERRPGRVRRTHRRGLPLPRPPARARLRRTERAGSSPKRASHRGTYCSHGTRPGRSPRAEEATRAARPRRRATHQCPSSSGLRGSGGRW